MISGYNMNIFMTGYFIKNCEQNGTPVGAGTPNEQTPIGNPCN